MSTIAVAPLTISPRVKWIDLPRAKQTVILPEPWPLLEANGFHADLTDRAYAHLAYVNEYGGRENALASLASLGEGFFTPFSRARFEPKTGDPVYVLKMKALDALEELA